MKKFVLLLAIVLCFFKNSDANDGTRIDKFNFNSFTSDVKVISPELDSLTSKEFKNHPEYGIQPYHAPCTDCYELLQKRDTRHRYFVIAGSKGKEFYQETSYSNENYYDESGFLRSIDPRIKPTVEKGIFKAAQQPLPVTINVPQKFTSLMNAGKELQFNRDVTLYIKHKDGSVTSLGAPSWSDYTAGDDGVVVHNFYPGIDMEMRVEEGAIETNYRINKPLHLADGWLVVHDNVSLPQGFVYDYSNSDKKEDGNYEGALCINNDAGARYFLVASPAALDENKENSAITLRYRITSDGAYDMYVPVDWMNDAQRSYPLIIDPYVMATSTFPIASITGSGYSASCTPWSNGCPYNLNVTVPAACIVTDVRYTFYYQALGTCQINQGAFDLTYGACRSPMAANTFHTCTINLPCVCQSDSLSCFGDVQSCIPPPQCASYTMPFTLRFYRCTAPGAGCGFSCISANTDWIMYVRGRTVELATNNASVCKGASVTLTAHPTYGVPVGANYVYTWNPAPVSQVDSNATFAPIVNTTYTVTVSVCGGIATATATSQVTVIQSDNPGFTISPNPACPNTPVTITGNGNAYDTCYNWKFQGGNPIMVNWSQSNNVTFSGAGNHNITFTWVSPATGCHFDSVLQVTINPNSIPSVSISAVPNGPICPGTNVTFTANVVNGGPGPTYQWYLNGNQVPGATNNPFSSSSLNNGDKITVHITSNAICPLPDTAVSNIITMVVTPISVPSVSIVASPSGPICPGSNVTFTAAPGNGGSNPSYQWYLNGSPVGSGGTTYSSSTLNNGDQIIVHLLNSNVPCAVPDSAVSNLIVITVSAVIPPSVTIVASPSDTICPGTNVTFTAAPNNQGSNPLYQWYVNGNAVGAGGPTYSSAGLNNGDNITVHLLNAIGPCIFPDTAVSNVIVMVVAPNVVPSVTISVLPSNTICAGDNVTFSASSVNPGTKPDYQWYVNGTQVGTNDTTYSSSGLNNGDVITVHLLHSDVLCVTPDSAVSNAITMVVNPLIVPSVSIVVVPSDTICAGTNVTFTASPLNGGSSPNYQWYINGNPVGSNATVFSSAGLNNGDMITVHLLNSNVTCPSPDSAVSNAIVMVVIPQLAPTITIAPVSPVCAGSNITFNATPTLEGTIPIYQWYVNGSPVGTSTPSYSSSGFNDGDIVTVHLLNSDVRCISPDSAVSNAVAAVVNPIVTPSVSIVASPSGIICQGQTITFTATPTGGGPSPSYQWLVNGAPQGPNDSIFSSAVWKDGDIVSVVLTSSDPCASPATANSNQIIVRVNPPMTVLVFGDTTVCPGESVPILAIAGGGEGPPYTYSWTWNGGAVSDSSTTVTPQTTTVYTISATDACGSTPATKGVTVTVSPLPKPDFIYNPSEPTEYSRTVFFTDKSNGAVSWNWNFGDPKSPDDSSTLRNPSHAFTGIGGYTVRLIIVNSTGCIDSISYRLEVTEEYTYYIPNAFSPNADGVNDYFSPQGTHDLIYEMSIYNRWGEKVFETIDTSQPWNGQVTGSDKVAEAGVYVYHVRFKDSRYTSNLIVGSVTLVR